MSEPTPLNPLLMLKAITKDTRFTSSEARFLNNAVLHTDNGSRKVRYSVGATAREVDVSDKTGSRAIKKADELGYFANVNRYRTKNGTVVDVWFKSLPPTGQEDDPSITEGQATGQATGQEDGPSTPSTSSTTTKEDSALYPCFECGATTCGCATEETAPEVAMCENHLSFVKGECDYCDRRKPMSNLPLRKQEELHEKRNVEEGWEEHDDRELRGSVPRYRGRSRA